MAAKPSLAVALLWAARPKTLLLALSPVLVGTAVAYAEAAVRPWVAVASAVGALALQVGTNFVNDWADAARGTDDAQRLGPARMTALGWVTPGQAQAATAAAALVAIAAGATLVWQGGWPVVAVGLSGLLAGYAYTAGPFPLAYHGLGEVFAFAYFGPVAVVTTAYLHTGRWLAAAGAPGISMGALAAALLGINNLRDREGDARAHKRTLAVRLGERGARALTGAWLAVALAAPTFAAVLGLLPPGCLAVWLAAPAMAILWLRVLRARGRALNPLLLRTSLLQLAVALLLAAPLWWARR